MNRIDRLLSNLSIGRRLQALVLVPLLGLLVFPVMAAVRDYNTFTQAARIGEIVALEPEINSFVHDLQKERGITTGYIASNWSAPFHERLQAQWPATDETRARLRQALDSFDSASFGTGVSEPAVLVRARIAELESVRRRVRARDLSESENLRYYTGLIEALLDIVTQIGVLNEQPELFDIASAYIAILEIEERAGLERAIGTIGFSYGYFTPPVHEQYLDLIHTEKDFGEIFDRHAPPDLRGSLAEARSGTGFAKVRRLRNVAIENGYGVPVEDVTAAMWFDAATQMVDQLIEVKVPPRFACATLLRSCMRRREKGSSTRSP